MPCALCHVPCALCLVPCAYLLFLTRQYTDIPLTTKIMRKHTVAMMPTSTAAAEQSQSEKSEKQQNPLRKHLKVWKWLVVYHVPVTVRSWCTVWLCPVTVFSAVQVYVPLSEFLPDWMTYTASCTVVGFPWNIQVNFAGGTEALEQ